jgi:hypothetical protein
MTPRQLLALVHLHRIYNGGEHDKAVHSTPRSKPDDKKGSAGWLMAVSQNLEQNRPVGG